MWMAIRDRMSPAYAKLEGGLFTKVTKADVGSAYADLINQGISPMGWADPFYPDYCIPRHVVQATVECIESGMASHYTMPVGNLELRRAVARRLRRVNGIDADPERNILITPGSDSGLFYAMLPFIVPGDEVLYPDPSYPNNRLNIELMGGVPVSIPLYEEDAYQPRIEELEKRVTDRTKMILLTHPNNPTTTVFRRDRLEAIARLAVEHNLVVVVDQAFEDTVFDDIEFISPATLSGMWERTVSVFSVSKGMALSGFRVGYIVACDEIMDVLYGGVVNVLGATNTAAQIGAMAALEDDSFIQEYKTVYDRRRKVAYEVFNSIPGVSMLMPESGFYSWVNVSSLGPTAEICEYLIKEARVAVNDGNAYGRLGDGHIRVIHGALKNDDHAYRAMHRMKDALTMRSAKR
jgi:aspartate/methionine/tyrosine aminotransferase